MSSFRRTASFRLVRQGKTKENADLFGKDVESHDFFYDANDFAVLFEEKREGLAVLSEMGGIQGLSGALRTNLETGLLEDEVTAETKKELQDDRFAKRKSIYGANKYNKPPPKGFWTHCWEGLKDDMMLVALIFAGVISIILQVVNGEPNGWIEGVAILMAVVIVTFVGAFNNVQQDKQFRKLDDEKEEHHSSVVRAGKQKSIPDSELVAGDLVLLQQGKRIPADGIVIDCDKLAVNESKLTGEPIFIRKSHNNPFLFSGTDVQEGHGIMLVTSVGKNSIWGAIMESLASEPEQTPLQKRLDKVAAFVGKVGTFVAVALFIVLLIRFIIQTAADNPEKTFKEDYADIFDFLIISITIIVVAVPEGLPLAVTISLAYSMKKMAKDNNFVRVLSACETMGNATMICSDKTGTLTTNVMTVTQCWVNGEHWKKVPEKEELNDKILEFLKEGVIINSSAYPKDVDEKVDPSEWEWADGNPTEQAMIAWVCRYDMRDVEGIRSQYSVLKSYPFNSKDKASKVLLHGDDTFKMYIKGASERVLGKCTHIIEKDGERVELSEERKVEIIEDIKNMAKSGLRTLAVGYECHDHIDRDEKRRVVDPEGPEKYTLIGIVGIKDPVRPEVPEAVRRCQKAGIVVRMVTGDHLDTATHIAKECGILTDEKQMVMEGVDFRNMMNRKPDDLLEKVQSLRVLARSKPKDKEILVEYLKEQGEVVAVTGDGTNDAPALKKANVGLSMGRNGTDVAKEASEIIIMDDNFLSIVKAVIWGRSVYDNIKKFVQFQLTVNIVALTLNLIAAISGAELPLKAVQLLWVNLIMDTMAALALGTELPTDGLLDRKPFKADTSIISATMWRNIAFQSVYQLIVLIILMWQPFYTIDGEISQTDKFLDLVKEREEVGCPHGDAKISVPATNTTAAYTTCPKADLGDPFYWENAALVLINNTIVFNAFVMMQVFNEINARKVNKEQNVFAGFFSNPLFTFIIVITILFQAAMVELLGSFADTTGLTFEQWMICFGLGAGSLIVGVFSRLIPVTDKGFCHQPEDAFKGVDMISPFKPIVIGALEEKRIAAAEADEEKE